jgi:hypothetical protein
VSFGSKLTVSGILLVIFILGFGYYQWHHPWPSPMAMYPCLLVVGLIGFFLYATPENNH